ncbi:hypothetical protein FRC05_004069 [Tulasnella sp. 425]|nr:hypothetical protein FRC05_004069 [Tulasnella sp. 425]
MQLRASHKFIKRILGPSPTHVETRETLGRVELENENVEAAKAANDDPNKALELYLNTLNLMSSQLKGKAPASQEFKGPETEGHTKKTANSKPLSLSTPFSFEPHAEAEYESLLKLAFELDPENPEALSSLTSVHISQQRPDEARDLVQRSAHWKDMQTDDAVRPLLTRFMLELSMYNQALTILHGVIASDEHEVEAWYLQGWCFFLVSDALK